MSDDIEFSPEEPSLGKIDALPLVPGPTQAKMVAPSSHPEELFVDGVCGISARGGVFKIDLYKVIGIEEDVELRTVTHRLILHSLAMNELDSLIQQLTNAAKKAQEENTAA